MTNDKGKVIITENGWEIYEEDDDLINKELLTEDTNGLEDLLFTYADTLTLITAHATAQHEGEIWKVRPWLVVQQKKNKKMIACLGI